MGASQQHGKGCSTPAEASCPHHLGNLSQHFNHQCAQLLVSPASRPLNQASRFLKDLQ